MNNEILVIAPYWEEDVGTWVFDDRSVGLEKEPFVEGIPQMIDKMVAKIPNAHKGFRLLFSAKPFPGYQVAVDRQEPEYGGYWYSDIETSSRGWLCPALFRYFDEAPERIYVKAEERK
jgi:hypothetical protein